MRESNACAVSFLLGGLTGACVALMLTPRSGRQTRELVAERVRSGERSARRALERGQHALERGRDAVVSAAQEGERIAERSLVRVREAVGTVSERVTDIAEAVSGAPAEPPDTARGKAI
jgi:gas vesicle protein